MKLPFLLADDKEFDVVGFGTNAIDHLIRVPKFPKFGSKSKLDSYTILPGGEAASTMVGLQRLGQKTMYVGRFGGDTAGAIGYSSLVGEGVDVSLSETVTEAETQVGFIVIDEGTGERTILWRRDEQLAYSESDAPLATATRGRILHITPHDTRACISMARTAHDADVVVSIDVDNAFEGLEELLPFVDICLASEDLPQRLTGIDDMPDALREMRSRFECPIVGVTRGVSGSAVLCEDLLIETPAFDVPGGCIDTTGAGDAFRTGFLYGVLTGVSIEDCCLYANAVAALKCRDIGARNALPNPSEVQALLSS